MTTEATSPMNASTPAAPKAAPKKGTKGAPEKAPPPKGAGKAKRRDVGSSASSRMAPGGSAGAAFSTPTSSPSKAPPAHSLPSRAPPARSPGTRHYQELLDETKKAVEVIPWSDWERGDSLLTLPAGTVLRVVAQRKAMDRVTPKALFPFPKKHCIFCCLHALMRVSECFFQALQDRATTHDLVDELNELLLSFNCGYLIKPKTESQARSNSADEYRPPKFNGNPARKILANITTIIDKLFPPPEHVDEAEATNVPVSGSATSEVELATRFRLMWSSWVTVYNIISAPIPTDSQVSTAGKEVRRLVWRMSNFQQPDNLTSLYLHTMLCHLEELLEENGSVGQYNQTSVEANHKRQVAAWGRMGWGGVQGAKRISKGKKRTRGGLTRRQNFVAGVTTDPHGEHVAGQKALALIFPPNIHDDSWRHNYGEYQLMQCASALNLLRGLPFCGLHKAFVCKCDLLARQNRWQRLARIGRPEGKRRKRGTTTNPDAATHDDDEAPASPPPTTAPPSQAPTSLNPHDVPDGDGNNDDDSDTDPDYEPGTGDSDDESDEDIPHDGSDDEDPPER